MPQTSRRECGEFLVRVQRDLLIVVLETVKMFTKLEGGL